jgi:hypothetical protein
MVERFIGTLRRECLDHLLIIGTHHVAAVLREYVEHYAVQRRVQRSGLDTPPSVNGE